MLLRRVLEGCACRTPSASARRRSGSSVLYVSVDSHLAQCSREVRAVASSSAPAVISTERGLFSTAGRLPLLRDVGFRMAMGLRGLAMRIRVHHTLLLHAFMSGLAGCWDRCRMRHRPIEGLDFGMIHTYIHKSQSGFLDQSCSVRQAVQHYELQRHSHQGKENPAVQHCCFQKQM